MIVLPARTARLLRFLARPRPLLSSQLSRVPESFPANTSTAKRGLATQAHYVPPSPDASKERIVILGSGWGGYTVSRRLSPNFSRLVVSPRSYFVFTPLLTDAASGSLDFSHIVEPVRDPKARVDFLQAAAVAVDFERKIVLCESTVVKSGVTETLRNDTPEHDRYTGEEAKTGESARVGRMWEHGERFEVPYDKLVVAVGTVSRTFNTPGIRENAMFFKDIGDARRVRRRLRECFELAALPTTSNDMRRWLLHFAIVGAGATGTELAASLRDFIHNDLSSLYPSLAGLPRISLYDVSPKVLPMFDESLSQYAMETMKKEGIEIKTSHHIEGLRWGTPGEHPPYGMDPKGCLTLNTAEEGEEGVGMCVWATGNEMNKLVRDAINETTWHVKKAYKTGALLVDDHLRLQLASSSGQTATLPDVFALGDAAALESGALPATAQVTYQQARWLSTRLNKGDIERAPPFSFTNLGVLAYIGDSRALMELPGGKEGGRWFLPGRLTGRMAWLVWKSAYISMSMSWRNRLRVGFRWFLNRVFGRDVSRY